MDDPTSQQTLPVTVGMATTGRGGIAWETIFYMATLVDRPDHVVVSIAAPSDFESTSPPKLPFGLRVLSGPKGSGLQRNAILDTAPGDGILLFLDDDFLIAEGCISGLRRLFAGDPAVVMATGHVVADGLRGPGYDHAEGRALLDAAEPVPESAAPHDVHSAYGCNMALRASVATARGLRFDPRLPLYAWLEDLDFSRRAAAFGRIVEDPRLRGVHLATKVGRSSGVRLGYSQIANPIYLVRKGTLARSRALSMMGRNILANAGKALRPEAWIDRRGRLRGNLLALRDLVRGRCAPERVLEF